jgi:structural maintenance of chromosome 1
MGIYVKAKNFLVFQGDVENIAAKNPKEMTELFETISGSAALKKDYESVKQAAEEAEERFVRTFEKKRQITKEKKQIKEQKDEADHYQALLHELKATKTEYYLYLLYEIENEIKEKENTRVAAEEGIVEAKTSVADADSEAKSVTAETARIRLEISKQEKLLSQLNKEIEKKRPKSIQLDADVESVEKQVKEEQKRLQEKQRKQQEQLESISKLEEELREVEKMNKLINTQIEEETKKGKELKMAEAQLKEYRQLKQKAMAATAELQEKLNQLELQYKRDADSAASLENQIQHLNTKLNNNLQTIEDYNNQLQSLTKQLNQRKKELHESKDNLSNLRKKIANNNETKRKLTAQLAEIMEELLEASTEQTKNDADNRLNDALEIMKQHFPGVKGKVSELCKPRAKKYNLAITIALGRNMDSVVVDSHKTAIDCVDYLKNNRAGQLTFIPLDSIKVKPINELDRKLGGGLQLAIDVLDYDESILKALLYSLGNTLIADSLDEARRYGYSSANKESRHKIVALDGTVIHKSGNLEGGIGKFHAKARQWDENEINKLKQKREQIVSQLEALENAERLKDEEETLLSNVRNAESGINNIEAEIEVTNKKLSQLQETNQAIQNEITKLTPQYEELQAAAAQKAREMEKIKAQIDKEADKIFAKFSASVGVTSIREWSRISSCVVWGVCLVAG